MLMKSIPPISNFGITVPGFAKMALILILFLFTGNTSQGQYSFYVTDFLGSARYHRDTTFLDFHADSTVFSSGSYTGMFFSATTVYTWSFSDSTTQIGQNVTHTFTGDKNVIDGFTYTVTAVDTALGITATAELAGLSSYPDVLNCSYFGDSLSNFIIPWSACNSIELQAAPVRHRLDLRGLQRTFTMEWGDGTVSVDSNLYYGGPFDEYHNFPYSGVYKMRSSLVVMSPDRAFSCPVIYSPMKANYFGGLTPSPVISGSLTVCEGDTLRLEAHDTSALFHNMLGMTDLAGTDGHVDSIMGTYGARSFYWDHFRESDLYYYDGNRGDSVIVYPHIRADDTTFQFMYYNDCIGGEPIIVHVNVLRSTLPPVIGPKYLCSGTTYTYTNATSGGTWTTDNPAIASIDAATGVVTAISTGIALLRYHSGSGCPALKYITVNPASTPGMTGPATIMAGTVAAFSDSGAGSVWSTSNASVASVDASGNVHALAPGDAVITSSLNIGCDTFVYSLGVYVSNSTISTVVGTGYYHYVVRVPGTGRYSGDGVIASAADLNTPGKIVVDDSMNIYINDRNNFRIRKVDRTGYISTIAGTGAQGYSGYGGPATSARISSGSLALDTYNNIYFTDPDNNVVRKIDVSSGTISTVAGIGSATGGYTGDGGPATNARFHIPGGIAIDRSNNIYIADERNRVIRKVDGSGTITTVAGTGTMGYTGDGGPATSAQLTVPVDIAFDTAGNMYFTDNGRLRKVVPTGIISTVSSMDSAWMSDRFGEGRLAVPYGVWGAWYVTCIGSEVLLSNIYAIYRINSAGITNRVAGTGSTSAVGYTGDGGFAANAKIASIGGICADRLGNIYLSDNVYNVIRKVGARTPYLPAPAVSDTNIREIRIVDFADSITTSPCTYPANVNYTVHGAVLGHPSIYDSVYVKVIHGDGSIVYHVVTIDTATTYTIDGSTYYGYSYSGSHTYAGPGNYTLVVEGITNTGTYSTAAGPAFHPIFPILNLDACGTSGSDYIRSSVATSDTNFVCRTPYLAHLNFTLALHGSLAAASSIGYLVNFGDGSTDTVHFTPVTDGHGHYTANATVVHSYSFPGTFITSYRKLDSTNINTGVAFAIGSSCSVFSGYLYRDDNGNCNMDALETKLRYWPVAIINNTSHDTTFVWCDSRGRYSANLVDSSSYTIMPDYFSSFGFGGDSLTISCPSSGIYTLTPLPGHSYTQNFGFTCHGSATTLDMNVTGSGNRFVPGRTTIISLWASNSWGYICDSQAATVSVTIDTNLTYVGMYSGAAPSVSGRTLSWTFATSHGLLDFNPLIYVVTRTTAAIGDTIRNSARVMPITVSDPDTTDNNFSWSANVRGSYDPNEKEVSPSGFGVDGYIPNETPLTYTIHFQNTGTDTAYDITVVDTISNHLDLATLQLVSASHDVVVIQEGTSNVVKFRFNNVLLPDSTTNLSASNGYVSFNILPKPRLAAGTQIRNGAAIYFDYNPAVLTNATINTIEDTLRAIAGPSAVCAGSSITLTNSISGGIWASSNGHATVVGGVVLGVMAGIDTISYTVYGDQVATKVITVNPVPSAGTITGTTTICAGSSTTLSATAGGSWSSSSSSTASISSTGVLTGVTAGSATVSYSISNTCGTDVATAAITVNPLPVAATVTGGASTLCAGATTTFAASATGGAWSSSNPTSATVTGGIVTALAAGIDTIIYMVSNSCGSAATSAVITITTGAVAGTISGPTSVCVGSSVTLSPSVSGGIWSSGSIATISGGTLTGLAAGIDTVNYIVINSCGTAVARYIVTVNPLPVPGAIAGAASACLGATSVYTDAVTGGTWSSSDAAVASVSTAGSLNAIAVGTSIISYTVSNGCGAASATAAVAVAVVTMPVAGTITGATAVCACADTTLAITSAGGIWSSSNITIASVNSAGNVACIAAGSATISYTVTNICGTDVATLPITVNPVPVAGIISGPDSICNDVDLVLTGATAGGSWSSSAGTVASVSAVGRVHRLASGNTVISYAVATPCGTSVATHAIYVKPTSACNTGVITNSVAQTAIEVYPNPSHGEFTIAIPGNVTNVAIVVTDVAGRVITEIQPKNASDLKVPVSLGDVAPGTYLLRVTVDGRMYHDKLIVW